MNTLAFALLLFVSCFAFTEFEQEVIEALKQAQIIVTERTQNETDRISIVNRTAVIDLQKANNLSLVEQKRGVILMEATKILVTKFGPEVIARLSELNVDALLEAANGGPTTTVTPAYEEVSKEGEGSGEGSGEEEITFTNEPEHIEEPDNEVTGEPDMAGEITDEPGVLEEPVGEFSRKPAGQILSRVLMYRF